MKPSTNRPIHTPTVIRITSFASLSNGYCKAGFVFVHFFAGSLRPAACGALSKGVCNKKWTGRSNIKFSVNIGPNETYYIQKSMEIR